MKRINNLRRWYAFIAVILALSACRSTRSVTTPSSGSPVVVRPEQERLDLIINAQVQSLSENFSCTVEGVRVNGQVRMIPDSVIWISVNKIIEVGRIMLTPSRVQAYIKIGGRRFDGDYATFARQYGIDVDFATVQALLLGNCPDGCTLRNEPIQQHNMVTLQFNRGTQQQITISKDYATKLVSSMTVVCNTPQRSPQTPQMQIIAVYPARASIAGQNLPTQINTQIHSSDIDNDTQISFDKIRINIPLSFPFN